MINLELQQNVFQKISFVKFETNFVAKKIDLKN